MRQDFPAHEAEARGKTQAQIAIDISGAAQAAMDTEEAKFHM